MSCLGPTQLHARDRVPTLHNVQHALEHWEAATTRAISTPHGRLPGLSETRLTFAMQLTHAFVHVFSQ